MACPVEQKHCRDLHCLLMSPKHTADLPACSLSHVWFCATPWTVARQAPLSMGFSRQEYWSGLPFPPLGDLPYQGMEPVCAALTGGSLLLSHQGSPHDRHSVFTEGRSQSRCRLRGAKNGWGGGGGGGHLQPWEEPDPMGTWEGTEHGVICCEIIYLSNRPVAAPAGKSPPLCIDSPPPAAGGSRMAGSLNCKQAQGTAHCGSMSPWAPPSPEHLLHWRSGPQGQSTPCTVLVSASYVLHGTKEPHRMLLNW